MDGISFKVDYGVPTMGFYYYKHVRSACENFAMPTSLEIIHPFSCAFNSMLQHMQISRSKSLNFAEVS